jgi:hypothetical protein
MTPFLVISVTLQRFISFAYKNQKAENVTIYQLERDLQK